MESEARKGSSWPGKRLHNGHKWLEIALTIVSVGAVVVMTVLLFMLKDLKQSFDTMNATVQANAVTLATAITTSEGRDIWQRLEVVAREAAAHRVEIANIKGRIVRLESQHGRPTGE